MCWTTVLTSPSRNRPGRCVPRAFRATLDAETEQDLDRLAIEDSVIRDLARSLQPQRR